MWSIYIWGQFGATTTRNRTGAVRRNHTIATQTVQNGNGYVLYIKTTNHHQRYKQYIAHSHVTTVVNNTKSTETAAQKVTSVDCVRNIITLKTFAAPDINKMTNCNYMHVASRHKRSVKYIRKARNRNSSTKSAPTQNVTEIIMLMSVMFMLKKTMTTSW